MNMRTTIVLAGVGFLGLLAGCGEVFVTTTGGGEGGAGAGPAGGGGAGAQGGQGGSTSEGGGAACAAPSGDSCRACLHTECEEHFCECVGEPDCPDLVQCLADGTYYEICWQKNPNGISVLNNLTACGYELCPVCAYPEPDACFTCETEHCAPEVNACLSNVDCFGYFDCFGKCTNMGGLPLDCSNTCNQQHPGAAGLAGAVIDCAQGPCGEICGL